MSFLNKRRCKYNKKYFIYTTPKNFGRYKRSVLELPELCKVDTRGYDRPNNILRNSSITELIMDNLVFVHMYSRNGGSPEYTLISDNTKLKLVRFGTLETFTGSWTGANNFMINNNNLIRIEIGIDSKPSMNLSLHNPTNAYLISSSSLVEDTDVCANNLEQFLYNFREYIVKRLAVKSAKTYIYLHATTKSYILGEYAQSWTVPGESETYYVSLNNELTNTNWGLA